MLEVGAILILIVLVLALVLPTGPLQIDERWSEAMADLDAPSLPRIALWFNDLGRGLPRALTLVAIGAALLVRRRFVALAAFAVSEALTPLAVNLIKAVVDRPRPPAAAISASASSFPSGHAAYAAATGVSVVMLFGTSRRYRRLWVVLAVLFAAGMAWSRTYLQVHWLSDAIAGALLGAGIALVTFAVAQLAARGGAPRADALPHG